MENLNPLMDVAVVEVCTAWYADYYWNGEYWFTDYLGTTCTPSNTLQLRKPSRLQR